MGQARQQEKAKGRERKAALKGQTDKQTDKSRDRASVNAEGRPRGMGTWGAPGGTGAERDRDDNAGKGEGGGRHKRFVANPRWRPLAESKGGQGWGRCACGAGSEAAPAAARSRHAKLGRSEGTIKGAKGRLEGILEAPQIFPFIFSAMHLWSLTCIG
jgi:hypothetical protein